MATVPSMSELRAPHRAPVIVGLGDPVLADEAVGLHIMGELREYARSWLGRVEFVDAARPGHAPTEQLRDRPALVVLGTVARGFPAGTVHVIPGDELLALHARHPNSGPAGNTVALLTMLDVLGVRPRWVMVVGIEPARLERGVGLSDAVRASLPRAVRHAHAVVESMIEMLAREHGEPPGLGTAPTAS